MTAVSVQADNVRFGILMLIAAQGFTAVVDTTAKYLTSGMHPVQVAWGYFGAISLFLAAYAVIARMSPARLLAENGHAGLQLARSALLVATLIALFAGLVHMPIADAVAITFMTPLFVTVLAGPILGERVGVHRIAAVLLGLAGTALILQPGQAAATWAAVLPLLSALFFALFQIVTRLLAGRASMRATLYHTAIGSFLWTSLIVWAFWQAPTWTDIAIFLAIGALGCGAHVCFIKAFSAAEASLLGPFNYVKLLWVTILGYLYFGDVPGPAVIGGGAAIVAGGLYIYWLEGRARRRPQSP